LFSAGWLVASLESPLTLLDATSPQRLADVQAGVEQLIKVDTGDARRAGLWPARIAGRLQAVRALTDCNACLAGERLDVQADRGDVRSALHVGRFWLDREALRIQ